jgi:endonuclease/exonuclease/phosphatase family metal-dependent hydrolase
MMTARARLSVAAALTATVTAVHAGQDPSSGQRPRPRIIATVSELLVHSPLAECAVQSEDGSSPRSRVATWNIRAARSAPLEAIAAELEAMDADVIALQEVDVLTRRSGFVDEPAILARRLGFHYAFAASIKWDAGDYGLAVLSRWPLVDVRRHRLRFAEGSEPRIVMEVAVCMDGRPLRLFNHHADGRSASREPGMVELREIVRSHVGGGLLLLGDLNEFPDGAGVQALINTGLIDIGAEGNAHTASHGRIDYLLADGPVASALSSATVWRTDKSDHHAVVADLEW